MRLFFETLDRFASLLVLCGAKRLLNTIPYHSLEVRYLGSSHSPTRVRASGEPRIDSVVAGRKKKRKKENPPPSTTFRLYVTCIFVNSQGTAACDGTGSLLRAIRGVPFLFLNMIGSPGEGEYGEKSDSFAAPGRHL